METTRPSRQRGGGGEPIVSFVAGGNRNGVRCPIRGTLGSLVEFPFFYRDATWPMANRWQYSWMLSLFFVFVWGLPPVVAGQPPVRRPPNLLLIVADDLGFSDLGCYGGEIQTPHLDELAATGTRLTQFYTTGRCCPSRASLLTGQYPHAVGLGHMTQDIGRPGYRGRVDPNAQTIAQRLRLAGYRCYLSGKWHLGTDDPTQHGFDSFYGTLTSAKTYWKRDHFIARPASMPPVRTREPFYGTDALTDRAIEFLSDGRRDEKPWFLYLAYNAPHFPLHARPETIAQYVDQYQNGWDDVRANRLKSMKRLGIVPPQTRMTPRSEYYDWETDVPAPTPAWDTLPPARRKDLARRMAIYAAMVDSLDQNIGRVLDDLRRHGELDNTLIVFTSDNGACAEWDPFGFDGESGPTNQLHTGDQIDPMGSAATYHSVGSGWAGASNSPWRLYKHFNHEGGIAVPCIITGPEQHNTAGRIDATPTHLIDVLPTLLDAAGETAETPGQSLLPLIKDQAIGERMLFFEHEGNRAVRRGRWKLVGLRDQPWQLFNISRDRAETKDIAEKQPSVVASLSRAWDDWAAEHQVTPLPDDYQVDYLPVATESDPDAPAVSLDQWIVEPVTKVADGYKFTEGPAWGGDDTWYFSDLPAKTMHRLKDGEVSVIRDDRGMSNGMAVTPTAS